MRGIIGLAIIAFAGSIGVAAEPTETITVTGMATVFVKPDSARINYAVRVSDASVDAAKDTASKQVATIGDAVKTLKLGNLSTTIGAITYSRGATGRVRPGAAFPGGPGGPGLGGPAGLGSYSAQVPLTATITDKDTDKLRTAVDAFIAKVVEGGATISGDSDPDSPFISSRAAMLASADSPRIDWFVSDDSAARRDAFRMAVRKAKTDAESVAKELGWEKLTVVSVADAPSLALLRDSIDPGSISVRAPAGEVAITARVTVKCSR
jgi:uncharacterized protein YggE